MVTVLVPDKNKLEFAIRLFRKKTQKEGLVREARRRKEFEKPCEMRKRKKQESRSRLKRKRKMY